MCLNIISCAPTPSSWRDDNVNDKSLKIIRGSIELKFLKLWKWVVFYLLNIKKKLQRQTDSPAKDVKKKSANAEKDKQTTSEKPEKSDKQQEKVQEKPVEKDKKDQKDKKETEKKDSPQEKKEDSKTEKSGKVLLISFGAKIRHKFW